MNKTIEQVFLGRYTIARKIAFYLLTEPKTIADLSRILYPKKKHNITSIPLVNYYVSELLKGNVIKETYKKIWIKRGKGFFRKQKAFIINPKYDLFKLFSEEEIELLLYAGL